MTTAEIIESFEALGKPSYAATLIKHGAQGKLYGVSVADLKVIQKKVKTNHELALALFDTKVSDAMYLAGLISDPPKMTRDQLQHWAETATWHMISEYAVAWTAAESPFGMEMALRWIESDDELVASAGWATLGNIPLLKKDEELDLAVFQRLLDRVQRDIHHAANRVRYNMNSFVLCVGGGIVSLTASAIAAGKAVGKVEVHVGNTACKVPDVVDYIQKMADRGVLGRKKKTVKC